MFVCVHALMNFKYNHIGIEGGVEKWWGDKINNMLHEPFLYEHVLFYVVVVPVMTA